MVLDISHCDWQFRISVTNGNKSKLIDATNDALLRALNLAFGSTSLLSINADISSLLSAIILYQCSSALLIIFCSSFWIFCFVVEVGAEEGCGTCLRRFVVKAIVSKQIPIHNSILGIIELLAKQPTPPITSKANDTMPKSLIHSERLCHDCECCTVHCYVQQSTVWVSRYQRLQTAGGFCWHLLLFVWCWRCS